MERIRSQSRVRALYQARATVSSYAQTDSQIDAAASHARGESLVPVTRTAISPGPDDVESVARVRINSQDTRTLFANANAFTFDHGLSSEGPRRFLPAVNIPAGSDSPHTAAETEQLLMYGSSIPFTANPLPMPLAEIMPISHKPKRITENVQIITVHRHAELAGR